MCQALHWELFKFNFYCENYQCVHSLRSQVVLQSLLQKHQSPLFPPVFVPQRQQAQCLIWIISFGAHNSTMVQALLFPLLYSCWDLRYTGSMTCPRVRQLGNGKTRIWTKAIVFYSWACFLNSVLHWFPITNSVPVHIISRANSCELGRECFL